ncbi:hypothetical protein LEP1GSC195_1804 [Leptospira wolbachii serovar Codice str. CDC]|uniref:Uncharacterized protein n=1 Tax=Leptospira wolbachii serovar Codice str. CDC TaxID=1218599 RepID=R9A8D4_9LEPT|nr:hypothetical protein [Leptospira wolbachii]EOQ96505.1 hypothetical protein LEP1GSC195_1804 [Leptospira wolbachii serovar Codice str. CDC]
MYKEKHNTAKFTKTNSLVTQVTAKFEKAYKIPEEKIHSVYVKPHPPAFLEGRELHYKDYYVQEKDGQKKVTFLEIHANKWIHTTVSSEAIVWK